MMHTSSSSISSLLGALAVVLGTYTLLLSAHARPISDAARLTSSRVERSTVAPNCSEKAELSGSCPTNISAGVIAKFRNEIKMKPNPLFLVAEMADLLHSEAYYNRTAHDCTLTHDALEDTQRYVENQIKRYLSVNDTVCPPSYTVTYYADRYPRYQIEVICEEEPRHIPPVGGASKKRCLPYHMGYVYYLTKGQCGSHMWSGNITACDNKQLQVWNKCVLNETSVGCRYGV